MLYYTAFSRISEPALRRLLMGDGCTEPLTGVTVLSPWVWHAVREIARRDGESVRSTLARAVRNFVISEGYNAPHCMCAGAKPKPTEKDPKGRPGLVARIAGHFKR